MSEQAETLPNHFLVRRILSGGGVAVALICLLAVAFSAVDSYQIGIQVGFGLVIENVFPGTPAQEARLEPGDVLVAANHQPLYTRNHFRFVRRAYRADEQIILTVARSGETVDVPLVLRRSRDAAQTAFVLFLVGLSFLVIGSLVFMYRMSDDAALVFFLACLALAFSYGTAYASQPLLGLLELSAFVVPSLVIHFFLLFPVRRPWSLSWLLKLLVYVPGVALLSFALLTCLGVLHFDWIDVLRWLPRYQTVGAVVGLGLLVYNFCTIRELVVRQQLKWIVWGVGCALGFNLLVLLFGHLGPLPHVISTNLANWSMLIVPVSFAFSIAQYRLFDIDTVINRSVVLSVRSNLDEILRMTKLTV